MAYATPPYQDEPSTAAPDLSALYVPLGAALVGGFVLARIVRRLRG